MIMDKHRKAQESTGKRYELRGVVGLLVVDGVQAGDNTQGWNIIAKMRTPILLVSSGGFCIKFTGYV